MKNNFTVGDVRNALKVTNEHRNKEVESKEINRSESRIAELEEDTARVVERTQSKLQQSIQIGNEVEEKLQKQKQTLEESIEIQKETEKKFNRVHSGIRGLYKYAGWIPFTFKNWKKRKDRPKTENEIEYEERQNSEREKEKERMKEAKLKIETEHCEDKEEILNLYGESGAEERIEKGMQGVYKRSIQLKQTSLRLKKEIEEQDLLIEIVKEGTEYNKKELEKYTSSLR